MQLVHVYKALQAVAPNSLLSWVSLEPHRGQGTESIAILKWHVPQAVPCGGAMPYWRNFSLASSLSQSVVHAGVYTVFTSTW